ncbi:MAG: DUF3618 domain-containing protein [Acetobacteraceae bacterium]|nr:DUF3618 domain-containing protein [Acetobacteraceae bacterium]
MSENTSNPDRIERDLDQTRARLDSRLSELQDRLSPGQVLDDLMSYFRGSEGADFGRNLLDSVKANPLPAALTGVGLAWLMAANQQPRRELSDGPATLPGAGRVRVSGHDDAIPTTSDAMMARVRDAELGVTRQQDEAEHLYSARLNEARGQAIGLTQQAQETAEAFGQRVQDALSSAAQTVTQGAHDLRDQVGSAAGRLTGIGQYAGQRAGDQLAQGGQAARQMGGNLLATLSDSPVLLGALGLAAGALLGALVPQSEQEEAALGGIAGQTRETARGLAQEAVDRGGRVAQSVLEAGQRSASERGLTSGKSAGDLVDAALSGDLAGSAKQVAQDALRAGDEAVRKEGLGQSQGDPQPT